MARIKAEKAAAPKVEEAKAGKAKAAPQEGKAKKPKAPEGGKGQKKPESAEEGKAPKKNIEEAKKEPAAK